MALDKQQSTEAAEKERHRSFRLHNASVPARPLEPEAHLLSAQPVARVAVADAAVRRSFLPVSICLG